MRRYKICFASVPSESNVVPFSGLTMREIFNRFVTTGQRPVENTNTATTTEDTPYNPDMDPFDMYPTSPVQEPVVESSQESTKESTQESTKE